MTSIANAEALTINDLRGSAARRRRELIIRTFFFLAAGTAVVISLLIVLTLIGEAFVFITGVDLPSLLGLSWQPRSGDFGLLPLLAGTFVIAIIAMVVAAPLGLGAAIFLAEYATPRVRRTVKPILEVLAAIPSVVLGFFTLSVISPTHRPAHLPWLHAALQHVRRRHRGRDPDHATGRVDLRGRHVRGPRRAA